jgi:CRP-like cAMP-binding protein/rhodanese-related sulfurtransferase
VISRDHPLAERILGLVPINSLDPRLQDQALAQGELLEFKRRKKVFEAGARDPYTFYLLDGDLELQTQEASPLRMRAGDENSRRALAQLQPRRYTAEALNTVTVFRIERAVLDHILADEQMIEETGGTMDVHEIEDDPQDDGGDWMTRLLSSELFIRLPHENIQRFFTELEPLEIEEGGIVVEQGTPGDYLYIVAEGRCAVVRRAPGAAQEVQLAVLKEGDTFGEEALLTNSPRNASVRMLSNGMLMRLPKRAFEELLSNPTLKAVPWSEACKQAEAGAMWLDVRFPDEHQTLAIEGSSNVPLNVLRLQAGKLDRDKRYLVYCDTGARSAAGAFLLARLGFEVSYLAGGLERTPLGAGRAGAASAPEPAAAAATAEEAPAASFEFEFVTAADTPAPARQPEPAAATTAGKPAGKPDAAAAGEPSAARAKAAPAPPPAAIAPVTAAATPAAAPAPAPAPPGPDMAEIRARLAKLKSERDQATAYGKKAADAAREFKRRHEEAARRIEEERTAREALEKELAALRAEAQRAESLEVARLKGETDKAARRLDALQRDLAAERDSTAAERQRLQDKLAESDARLAALAKEKQQAQTQHVAAEVAFEDTLRSAREEAAGIEARVQTLDAELTATRERLAEAEARGRAAAEDRAAQSSEVEAAMREAQQRLTAQREQLEQDRARAVEEVEQHKRTRQEDESRLRTERVALDAEASALRARTEELDQREVDLSLARGAVDEQLSAREAELAKRAAALAQEASDLSGEKEAWKQTVEQAIAEERARVESDYARYREQADAQALQRAGELAEERAAELRAEHDARETELRAEAETSEAQLRAEFEASEAQLRAGFETSGAQLRAAMQAREEELRAEFEAREAALRAAPEAREAQMRTQVEAHVAKLLAEFDARLAKVRSGYETRLAEQEAILEDERRRLETEVVRLREALADARQTAQPAAAVAAAPVAIPTPSALDFELDVKAAATTDLDLEPQPVAAAPSPAAPELDLEIDDADLAPARTAPRTAASVPELDLEIDDAELEPASAATSAATAAAPRPAAGARPQSTVPAIELVDEDVTQPAAAASKDAPQSSPATSQEEKRRVIAADQLADLRKRMQEKMRAAKSKAG